MALRKRIVIFVLGLSNRKCWRKIYTELVTILGMKVPFNWDELLFVWFTKKWLKPNSPSIEDCYIIHDISVIKESDATENYI